MNEFMGNIAISFILFALLFTVLSIKFSDSFARRSTLIWDFTFATLALAILGLAFTIISIEHSYFIDTNFFPTTVGVLLVLLSLATFIYSCRSFLKKYYYTVDHNNIKPILKKILYMENIETNPIYFYLITRNAYYREKIVADNLLSKDELKVLDKMHTDFKKIEIDFFLIEINRELFR